MRSLFVVAAALCAALYPLSSPRAQQAAPAAPAASGPVSPVPGGSSYRLTVLENDASRGALLFQPVREPQTEPSPAVAAGAPAGPSSAVATSAPVSPAQAAAPAASPGQTDAAGQPASPPGRPADLDTAPRVPLYAPASAVEIAWNQYAPRRMAYAPRAWLAPDPAMHSALPVRRTAAKRNSSGQTANAPAQSAAQATAKSPGQTPVQQGFDALVSVVTALCPPQATPAPSADETKAAASPAPAVTGATPASSPARGVVTAPNPAAPR